MLIGLILSVSIFADNKSAQPLDKIAAVINNEIITESQVQQQIDIIKKQNPPGQPLPPDAELRKKVLQHMIDQKMILILAQRNKMTITDAQLDKAIDSIAARNNLTIEQLKMAIAKQGLTYDQFRKQIHDQMLIQQVEVRALGPTLNASHDEVIKFMKEHAGGDTIYQVEDILIATPANANTSDITAATQKANTVLSQLQQGANISADQSVQTNNLGWRHLSELPELFSSKLSTMKAGEITGPVVAPNGVHLIKLVAVRGNSQPLTFQQAKNLVLEQKLQAALQPWLDKLMKSAYVKIMD